MTQFPTLTDIHQAYAEGASVVDVVTDSYTAINTQDKKLGAVLSRRQEQALSEAQAADARRKNGQKLGPLDGVPMIVKDNMTMAGEITTAASNILKNYVGVQTATAVERLQSAGAIILGKANLDEFAMGASTENSAYQVTKNPWDETKVPGGSSGGSAVSVAAGYVPVSLGSDTGGSIRQPAGFCNLVGFKPTYGRVSRSGLIALASSLDQIGPFAHTVEDAAAVYEALAGCDHRDATTSARPVTPWTAPTDGSLKGIRVGVPKEFFQDGLDSRVKKVIDEALTEFEAAGAQIIDVSLPLAPLALAAYYILLPAEASANLARFDGVRYGLSERDGAGLREMYSRTRGKGFGREVQRRMMIGTFVLSAGYGDAYYHQAVRLRRSLTEQLHQMFDQVDVLLSPTSPTLPFDLGARTQDPLSMYLADLYTVPANLAGIPALSLPAGFAEGLPVGLQLMAAAWNETTLFSVGAAYQHRTEWHTKNPPRS